MTAKLSRVSGWGGRIRGEPGLEVTLGGIREGRSADSMVTTPKEENSANGVQASKGPASAEEQIEDEGPAGLSNPHATWRRWTHRLEEPLQPSPADEKEERPGRSVRPGSG